MLGLIEYIDQGRDVVSVDRTDGHESKMLEPRAFTDAGLRHFAELVIDLGHALAAGNNLGKPLGSLLEFAVGVRDTQAIEVRRHRALRLGDGHAVVIQDHQKLPLERSCVVQAFHGNAVDDRRITNDGHHSAAVGIGLAKAFAVERVATGHTDGGGNRSTSVTDGKQVVRAFARLRKS